jgi:hypothetical protein
MWHRVASKMILTPASVAGRVKIIVEASNRCIEDPAVIERILAPLNDKAPFAGKTILPEDRAPPQTPLFD